MTTLWARFLPENVILNALALRVSCHVGILYIPVFIHYANAAKCQAINSPDNLPVFLNLAGQLLQMPAMIGRDFACPGARFLGGYFIFPGQFVLFSLFSANLPLAILDSRGKIQ